MNCEEVLFLKERAKELRLLALEGIHCAKSGHPGGSFSIAEILAYLYFKKMRVYPDDPKRADRDRFVLSKGHGAPALYAALAMKGYFSKDELKKLRQVDALLQGHPDSKKIPGIDISTGSLGQGFSAAVGMAFAGKDKFRVYTVIGDGEIQEGQVWEAAMMIKHYNITNLFTILDLNRIQLSGDIYDIAGLDRIDEKFASFGIKPIVCDGHDIEDIDRAFTEAENAGVPTVLICNTVKGKGVSYMENNPKWHGSAPDDAQYEQAVKEITASV